MTGYYDGPDLEQRVLDALQEAGRSLDPIDPDDLAGLDEFHALGRAGTLALAKLADVQTGQQVLDVGAGIGGPSRVLARHYEATVTALEPTERFARLARTLTDRSGLTDGVAVIEGDGRAVPFPDASFDLAWTQAIWQSVEDKASLAREIKRVLRPGGRLALLEVIGDGRELKYPVPWADGPAQSFVVTGEELASLLKYTGFAIESWHVGVAAQTAILAATADTERMAPGLPGLGLDLLMPDYTARMAGLASNVEAGRISLLLAVVTKEDAPTIPPTNHTDRATPIERLDSREGWRRTSALAGWLAPNQRLNLKQKGT